MQLFEIVELLIKNHSKLILTLKKPDHINRPHIFKHFLQIKWNVSDPIVLMGHERMNYLKHNNSRCTFVSTITTDENPSKQRTRSHNLSKKVYHAHYLPTAASLTATLHVLHNPIGFRDTVAGLIAWIIRLKQLCTSITTLITTGTHIEEKKVKEN